MQQYNLQLPSVLPAADQLWQPQPQQQAPAHLESLLPLPVDLPPSPLPLPADMPQPKEWVLLQQAVQHAAPQAGRHSEPVGTDAERCRAELSMLQDMQEQWARARAADKVAWERQRKQRRQEWLQQLAREQREWAAQRDEEKRRWEKHREVQQSIWERWQGLRQQGVERSSVQQAQHKRKWHAESMEFGTARLAPANLASADGPWAVAPASTASIFTLPEVSQRDSTWGLSKQESLPGLSGMSLSAAAAVDTPSACVQPPWKLVPQPRSPPQLPELEPWAQQNSPPVVDEPSLLLGQGQARAQHAWLAAQQQAWEVQLPEVAAHELLPPCQAPSASVMTAAHAAALDGRWLDSLLG